LESGKVIKLGNQTILQGKNNLEYYISDSVAPIFDDNRDILGTVLVFSDMTEHFKQEEKVHVSEERLNLAVSATKAGLWDWYLSTGKVVFNERWAKSLAIIFSTADQPDI
jgi:PAS domain-containing protein